MEETARVHSKSKHRSSSSRHREHRKKEITNKIDDETTNVGVVEAGINDENFTVIEKDVVDQTSISIENEIKSEDKIQKGILGYMDRQLKVGQATPEPPRSPAQRSTRSNDKSPKHKRSRDKSESRRRRERKLQAAGEMEVRQANETLMRYLKQCSDLNEASASLSGDLEISENLDDRRVQRKTKSQREKKSFRLIGKSQPSDLTTILNELNDDIIPNNEIYNPFTPVVSPTEQHGQVIDKIFIQTSNGYRACDNNSFYKNSTTDGVSNSCYSIKNAVHLSCHVQKMWINISNVCHGLLGGLALAHMLFILTTKPADWSGTESSIEHYAMHAKIYTNLFFFLAVICFVSILDRIDICQFSMFNTGDEKTHSISFRSVIMIMIYAGTIVLNLSASSLDERFYSPHLAAQTNATLITEDTGKEDLDSTDMVYLWNTLSIARSLLAIFGWLMVSASNTDQLYNLLIELDKYHVHP